jgi:ferredoxin
VIEEDPMRVHVNPDICQGHGVCHMSAPDVFQLRDEDGHAYVVNDEVAEDQSDDAWLGADSCPERAITVGD